MNIETIFPENWQGTRGIFSPAKKVDMGNCYLIYVSGVQADKNEKNEAFSDDIEKQTENVFQNIEAILKASGASIDNVVKAQIFLTDLKDFKYFSVIRDKWFCNCKPVSSLYEVNGFTRKGAKVEIEVVAILKKEH